MYQKWSIKVRIKGRARTEAERRRIDVIENDARDGRGGRFVLRTGVEDRGGRPPAISPGVG